MNKAVKKINSPLEALTSYLNDESSSLNNSDNKITLKFIETSQIINWKLSDRPANELGDIEELGKDILQNGQIQPCIVRRIKNIPNKYELIVGERRWRACKLIKSSLSVIVTELSDDEALLIQASENEKRESLSDYAKGKQYSKIIKENHFSQELLAKKLCKSRAYIRQLLSFDNLDPRIIEAIGNLSKISSRTSYEIYRWQQKGERHVKILVSLGEVLRKGDVGAKKLANLIQSASTDKTAKHKPYQFKNDDGQTIFTWKNKLNGEISITISKQFSQNIERENITKLILDNI